MKIKILFFGIFTLFALFLVGCSTEKFNEYVNKATEEKLEATEQEQRELLTLDNFKSVSKKFGYEIEEVKDFDKKNIKTLTFAKKDDYKIEYYIMKNNKIVIDLFNSHKKELEKIFKKLDNNDDDGDDNDENSVYNGEMTFTGENSDYFSVVIGNDYNVIYRIDCNFIYLKVDASHQNEIQELLTELGCYKVASLGINCILEATSNYCKDSFGLLPKSSKKDSQKDKSSGKFNEDLIESAIKNRELLTLDNFKSVSKKFGYEIEDVKDFDLECIKSITLAKKKNCKIQFYETKNNEVAINLFNLDKKDFEKQYEEAKSLSKSKIEVGRHISLEIGNNFKEIYQINNYFIYLESDKSSKKEIKKLFKKIGCYDSFSLFCDSFSKVIGKFFKELFK